MSNYALTRCDVRTCSGFPCPQGLQVVLPQLTNETVVSAARKRSCLVPESGQVLALSPSTRIAYKSCSPALALEEDRHRAVEPVLFLLWFISRFQKTVVFKRTR